MKFIGQDYNSTSNITTQYFVDWKGNVVVRGVQDVEPVLKDNTSILNGKSSKTSKLNESEGLGTRVASIPTILVDKWMRDHGLNVFTCSNKDLFRMLDDVSYRKLRTAHGRLG